MYGGGPKACDGIELSLKVGHLANRDHMMVIAEVLSGVEHPVFEELAVPLAVVRTFLANWGKFELHGHIDGLYVWSLVWSWLSLGV